MKLISNFKDYYDYMIGITGIDNKVVFHRGNLSVPDERVYSDFCCQQHEGKHRFFLIAICGKRYFAMQIVANREEYYSLDWKKFRLITKEDLKN